MGKVDVPQRSHRGMNVESKEEKKMIFEDFQKNPVLVWARPISVYDRFGKIVHMPSAIKPVMDKNKKKEAYFFASLFGMKYNNLQTKIVRFGKAKEEIYIQPQYGYNNQNQWVKVGSQTYQVIREQGRMKIIVSSTNKVGEKEAWLKEGTIMFRGTESVLDEEDWQKVNQAIEEAKYVLKNVCWGK